MAVLGNRELLCRLVAIDSTCGTSNLAIADAVCTYLDRPGVRLKRIADEEGARVNVVAWMGPPSEQGRGLTLSGHMDTVPAREPQWTSDPFTLTERGAAWYGRGTCDMKGFVALALNLFLAQDDRARALAAPLCLVLTYDEELGSLGARRLVERGADLEPIPRATIIGEPTSLRAIRLHKGHLQVRLKLRGRAAHSGSPHLGSSAIEPAGAVIGALIGLRHELEAERVESSVHFPVVPFAALNIGRIRGGDSVNVIPPSCHIDVGIRPLPGQEPDTLVQRLTRAVRTVAESCAVEVLNDNPPMELSADAPVHRALCDVLGPHQSEGATFASDAGHLQRLGLDCVLFGPGSIEDAHRPDEHVPIDQVERCGDILRRLSQRFCGPQA